MLSASQKRYRLCKHLIAALALPAVMAIFGTASAYGSLNGAIFTTIKDGTPVDRNIYDSCADVYLNGGPQNQNDAGLTPGTYYFQVTVPGWHPADGATGLLSTDAAECRQFTVDASGRIIGATGSCPHPNGDFNPANGSTTVQLWPFDHTSNPGGEHKAWAIRFKDADGIVLVDKDSNPLVTADGRVLFFNESDSKSDNFKCRHHDECADGDDCGGPPQLAIGGVKYCDSNGDGALTAGESTTIANWPINVSGTLPDGTPFNAPTTYTDSSGSWSLVFPQGTIYTACEGSVSGYTQTGPISGATSTGGTATANASKCWGGTLGVDDLGLDFFNVAVSSICVHKFYDANVNGLDDDSKFVVGWKINLTGTDYQGASVTKSDVTGADGSVCFPNLLPGSYTVSEAASLTGNWIATTATTSDPITLDTCTPSSPSFSFGNVCTPNSTAGLTLGFWCNQNGQKILTGSTTGKCLLPAVANLLNSPCGAGAVLRNANGTIHTFSTSTTSYADLKNWLLNATASNMAYMLSAQLAANVLDGAYHSLADSTAIIVPGGMKTQANACIVTVLNTTITTTYSCAPAPVSLTVLLATCSGCSTVDGLSTVGALRAAACCSLSKIGVTTASGPARTYQECVKDLLDVINNNGNPAGASAYPCGPATLSTVSASACGTSFQ
jgi:hypothetical protein